MKNLTVEEIMDIIENKFELSKSEYDKLKKDIEKAVENRKSA